jgi:hypothetical protein
MEVVEHIAQAPPFNASLAVLDIVQEGFQLHSDFITTIVDNCSHAQPKVLRSNEAWFERQGYEVFQRLETGYMWHNPKTGELISVPLVFLRKLLSG